MSLTISVCVSRLLSSHYPPLLAMKFDDKRCLNLFCHIFYLISYKKCENKVKNFHQSKVNSILCRFTEYTMSEKNATAISGLGGLVVMMLARIAKDWGLIPH